MIPFIENWGGSSLQPDPPHADSPVSSERPAYVAEALLLLVSFAGYASVSVLPVFTQTDSRVFTEPFRYLVVGLTLFTLFRIRKSSFTREVNVFLVLYAGLWYMMFLRMFWHFFYPMYSADDKTLFELFQFSLGSTFLPTLAILLRGNKKASEIASRFLAIVLPLDCILVLYCAFFVVPQEDAYIRLSLPTLNPISVGYLGVTTLIVAVWRHAPAARSLVGRNLAMIWKVFSAIIGLVALGLSASKGPIVSMLVVVMVAVIAKEDPATKLRMAMRAIAVIAAGILILVGVEQETHYKPLLRISEAMNPAQAAEEEVRGSLIEKSLEQFVENPLFGGGIVERESGQYPHNIFVESLLLAGVLGGVLCIGVVAYSAIRAWHLVVAGGEFAWVGLIFVQRLVSVQFSGSLYTASEFWAAAALVMALAGRFAMDAKNGAPERSSGEERTSFAEGRA